MKTSNTPVEAFAIPVLRVGGLSLAMLLAACGGGGGGGGGEPTADPFTKTINPAVVEFELVSGGAACGSNGCDGDNADQSGVSGGGDGGSSGGDGGGGDGGGGGLGAMRNIKVTARKPDGTVLGSAALQNNLVSLYARTYKGAFILEFADDGTGNGAYFDESKKAWVPLAGQILHILVPSLNHHVSANPLTESAYQLALSKYANEGALTAARMSESNEAVRASFNSRTPAQYAIGDITNYAVAVSDTTTAQSLPNTHAGRYGTLLASLPRAASAFNQALAAPALSFLKQLVADVKDDGTVNNSVPAASGQQAYGSDITHALADAVASAKADYGSTTQPAPVSAPSVCLDASQYAIGSTWTVTTRDTNTLSGTTNNTVKSTVTRRTTDFMGLDAIEVKVDVPTGNLLSYRAPDVSAGVTTYGSILTFNGDGGSGSALVVDTPPDVSRDFLLRPGETQSRTITTQTTLKDATGATTFGPQTISLASSSTFVGFEDVTVPAGTFKGACKFINTNTSSVSGVGSVDTTTTNWITASGQGVSVKSVTTGTTASTSELLSGTVNGQPVR